MAAGAAAVCVGACLLVGATASADGPQPLACSFAALQSAVAAGGDWQYGATCDVEVSTSLTVTAGRTVSISAGGHNVTLTRSGSPHRAFDVAAGGTLRLYGVVVEGFGVQGESGDPGEPGQAGGPADDGNDGGAPGFNGGGGSDGHSGGAGTSGDPGASARGGAIENLGTVYLDHVTVRQNAVTGGNGGNGGNGGDGSDGGNGGDAYYGAGATDATGGNGGSGANGGSAGSAGGGGTARGGAIYNEGALVVVGSSFVANVAAGGNGGDGGIAGDGGGGGSGGWGYGATGNGGNGGNGQPSGESTPGAAGGSALGGAIYNAGTAVIGLSTTFQSVTSGPAGGVVAGNGGSGGQGGVGGPWGSGGYAQPPYSDDDHKGGDGDGGPGSAARDGGAAGDARGGAIYNADGATLTVGTATFTHVKAFGGQGGDGGMSGADWLGPLNVPQTAPGDGGDGGSAVGPAVASAATSGSFHVSPSVVTTIDLATPAPAGDCFAGPGGEGGLSGDPDGTPGDMWPDGTAGNNGGGCSAAISGSSSAASSYEPTVVPFAGGGDTGGGGTPGGGTSGGGTSGGGSSGGGSSGGTSGDGDSAAQLPQVPVSVTPVGPAPSPKPTPFVAFTGGTTLTAAADGTVQLSAKCPAGGPACKEKLTLTATQGASTAAANKKARPVTLASKSFTVAAGKTGKVRLKLSKAGLALLKKAKGHKLKAKATITAGSRTTSRTVTLKLAPAKKKT